LHNESFFDCRVVRIYKYGENDGKGGAETDL
jgi:hypothetical protein